MGKENISVVIASGAGGDFLYRCLDSLKDNSWNCQDWMLANVEPDGTINLGCYVKGRGAIQCSMCGFAAHTEISKAFDLNPGAILAGHNIFRFRML